MCKVVGSIKRFFISIWNYIKLIRQTPSWFRAGILFVIYTLATKPLEGWADRLSTMHNLISTNVTYIVEAIKTDSKDFWMFWLQALLIIIFVIFASWVFGDDGNRKEMQKLQKSMDDMPSKVADELESRRQQNANQQKTKETTKDS